MFEDAITENHLLSLDMYPNNPAFKCAYEKFDIRYGFLMPFIDKSYKEVFYFSTTSSDPSIFNFYLQNIDNLKLFKCYFKEQAANLIKKSERKKLPTIKDYIINNENLLPKNYLNLLPDEIKKSLFSDINFKRYYLIHDIDERYLTMAEYQCAIWLIKGKSAREISIILGTSHRTIETHLINMKNKFECNKLPQLIYNLVKLGFNI